MKYKNNRTGEIRDFNCTIKSKFWQPLENPKAVETFKEKVPEKPVKKSKK